jgi:hypothetical protein
MLTGYEGCAERVAHCALSAHRLSLSLARHTDMPAELRDEVTKIALLVSEIPADVAQLADYITAQDEDMHSLRDSGLRMAQQITALMQENDALRTTAERYVERDVSAAPTKDDATAA